MHPTSSVFSLASALVQHAADSTPEERDRRTIFVAKRLAVSFAALASVPLLLAFRGAPSLPDTLVFACSLTPLAGATVAARTGRIVIAHAIIVLGLAGLGMSLWLGLGMGGVCAVTWLLAAHVEARSAGDAVLSRLAAALTFAFLVTIVALPEARLAASQGPTASLIAAALALVYSWVAYAGALRTGAPRKTDDLTPDDATLDDETTTWRAIAEATDDIILVFDVAGSVEHVRIGKGEQLGLNASNLMGRGLFDRVIGDDRSTFLALLAEAFRKNTATATISLRTSDNVCRQFDLRVRKILSEDVAAKARSRFVAILRNGQAKHSTERTLAQASQPVDDADRSKHQFIARMSHELRTPLNAIIGFSEMLGSHTLRPADIAKQYEYARIINQSGQHLLSVVNAILDMSKINAGTFPVVVEPFDVVPLVEDCCDIVALSAEEGGVQIVREYADLLEMMVGDKRACQQILINLLANAVKFTPSGGTVTVSVKAEGTGLALVVSDTGIGIDTTDLAKLGEPFFQAVTPVGRTPQGSGLGLSVVRGLVGLHGGSMAIESELGRGTSVKVHLPQNDRAYDGNTEPALVATSVPRRAYERAPRAPEQRMKEVA